MQWAQIEARTFWLVMAASFLVVAIWESLRPHRDLSVPGGRRWSRHGILLILSSVTSVAIYRIGPVVVAAAMVLAGGLLWLRRPQDTQVAHVG